MIKDTCDLSVYTYNSNLAQLDCSVHLIQVPNSLTGKRATMAISKLIGG